MKNDQSRKLIARNGLFHVFSILDPLLMKTLFSEEMTPALKAYKVGQINAIQYLWKALTTIPVLGLTVAWIAFLIGTVMLNVNFLRNGESAAKKALWFVPLAVILFAASVWFFLLYLLYRPA